MITLSSQNDPRWRNNTLGHSSRKMKDFGCTTNCISDASSYFGEETTPAEVAKLNIYTPAGLILWPRIGIAFKKFTFEWRGYDFDSKKINEALKDPDKVVLLNVSSGKHWVFLTGMYISFLGGYKVSDPYPCPAGGTRRKDIVGYAILRRK